MAADIVVVAIGLTPEVSLAVQAGLALDLANGGIAVNAAAAAAIPICTPPAIAPASIAPASAWRCGWNPGRTPTNRRAPPRACWASPLPAEPYPWFWTDQYGCNVQMLACPSPPLVYACRGVPQAQAETPRFIWLGHRDGVRCTLSR